MKISSQFQNITNSEYYALIRSYIENCHRNDVNEYETMERLINNNSYYLKEILTIGNENSKKNIKILFYSWFIIQIAVNNKCFFPENHKFYLVNFSFLLYNIFKNGKRRK